MDGSAGKPSPANMSENSSITLPDQLKNITPAAEFPTVRPRWNTNEEIASVLIAFDRHKEWQLRELKIRPQSGSMLLYSRNKVRYRKDGYCWKKRRDGKTIREDHMKLKVQGVECIYGSYVHSAILPTFHRRCYWLLQNPDVVLVHYLNVPYPDNTKLSIPVLSYDMEKKEWTKEELVDQLRPMLAFGRQIDLGPEQEHMVEQTIEDFVQQLINLRQDKSGKPKSHKCTPCDKNFPHSKCTKDPSPSATASLAHNRFVSMLDRQSHRSATQSVAHASTDLHTSQVVITRSSTSASTSTHDLNHTVAAAHGPLILNLASIQGSNGLILVSGQNTSPISIINNSLAAPIHTVTPATLDAQGHQPQILQTIPQVIASVKQEDKLSNIVGETQDSTNGKSPVPMNISSDHFSEATSSHPDPKPQPLNQMSVSNLDAQRNLHNTLDSLIRGECSHLVGTAKDNVGMDNCDTLDGSFSSFPSTDLSLDYLLDLPELYDCADLTDANASLGTTSSNLTSSVPLINCASCLSNQRAQQTQQQHEPHENRASSSTTTTSSAHQTAETSCPSDADTNFTQAVITDFSPDWSYTDGGTKILVTGPWFTPTSSYSVIFNSKTVPATLVQGGVLRCFTPAHEAGLVTLQVAKDSFVISNCEVFEYRAREKQGTQSAHNEWFSMDGTEMKLLLIERLEQIEKRLMPADKNTPFLNKQHNLAESEDSELFLVQYVDHLAGRTWMKQETYPKAGHGGMTLLHLAAALGYAKLVSSLIRWRSDIPNLVLEYEVDAHSVDNHACTPLMWASARGNIDAALTLYHLNTGPLNICNKDGHLPLTVARAKGHHNLANQIEQLEQSRLQAPPLFPPCTTSNSFASRTPSFTSTSNQVGVMSPTPCQIFPASSPTQQKEEVKQEHLHIDIPPPPPYPGDSKLVRRLSEQAIGSGHRQLSKRYSVDILPSGAINDQTSPQHEDFPKPIREAYSEPHLSLAGDQSAPAVPEPALLSVAQRDLASPDILMQTETLLNSIATESVKAGDGLLMQMDTDEVSSVRSDSPFIDVEKISSDEEAEHKKTAAAVSSGEGGDHDGKNQMVTLANQIIAAMPERIKLSPAKEEEIGVICRPRSESYSSAQSQASPPTSTSFGDDSGISTPMTDSLAFDEYRYTDLGTPASSLSPDSTCLPSPYSPYSSYSFTLDSPPPTTADFTEYFNAPATYMEKDFSQLTLSDQEQRKLYEAAKVIQNAYRLYRDKQQLQQQRQKEIEAAILIQSYYRRYKQYAYFKKMTQAAVLIQNQFRSYYAQKRLKKSRDPSAGIPRQGQERLKKGRNQSVIIQQRYRSHYQRKTEKEGRQLSADAADRDPTIVSMLMR